MTMQRTTKAKGTKMLEIKCSTCQFWDQIDDDEIKAANLDTPPFKWAWGKCRRNCPVIVEGMPRGYWPVTNEHDWCGEWGSPEEEEAEGHE